MKKIQYFSSRIRIIVLGLVFPTFCKIHTIKQYRFVFEERLEADLWAALCDVMTPFHEGHLSGRRPPMCILRILSSSGKCQKARGDTYSTFSNFTNFSE